MPGPSATLLLPVRRRLAGRMPEPVARMLGRADRLPGGEPGEQAQLLRHFDLLPRGWPVAALTRQPDSGDAGNSAWLRADPAHVAPDINGARLLACGTGLQLQQVDVDALLPALRPLFGDAGFPIDAPAPGRWYLRLPHGSRLPRFTAPADALGADLFDQLPGADDDTDLQARRWRALLSETQVVLHNHPHNAVRVAAGKPPVNSLWFWGAGVLPDQVTSRARQVASDDALLRGLASAAGMRIDAATNAFGVPEGHALFDLRDERDAAMLGKGWLQPAMLALRQGGIAGLRLDFEDGAGFDIRPGQRWRFWRRPLWQLPDIESVPE